MLNTTNIIQNIIYLVNKNKGSSFVSPTYGCGGARATIKYNSQTKKNRAKPEKQKGKKEEGLGEGIFALLRLRIERFRFSLIKRNTKQINFLFLLKEKIAREKNKKCRENLSVLVPAEAKRRRAEMHRFIQDFVQRKFELRPENTANFHFY